MVEKIVKETKEVTKTAYYCDICGKKYDRGCSSDSHYCIICKRDICSDCARKNPLYDVYDEISVICKDCAEIVEPYKNKLDVLYVDYEREKEKIWKELREKARENIKEVKR